MLNLPANSPRKLNTKAKLPISIRFALRPGYRTVHTRITINGQEGSPFSSLPDRTTLQATGVTWNQIQQRATGRSDLDRAFNQCVDKIRTELDAIYERQKQMGIVITPKTVQYEFQTGVPGGQAKKIPDTYSPLACYRLYLNELETGKLTEKRLEQTTLSKWRYGLSYLETYIAQSVEPMSSGSADELTFFWGKSYHRWLMKEGPMSADSATRYVKRLIEAITYVAESGKIKTNPLAQITLSRDKTKDVHFLEPYHLERFWQLNLRPGRANDACFWMGVIFLTGLDYPDAVRYVLDRKRYEHLTPDGRKKIVINRSKPPKTECHIPMTMELETLLQRVPVGSPPADGYWVNDEMKAVETLIGFEHRLTCKVGRKTAGAIFFREYKDIGAVSRMMGHSSVSITERYYVKTTSYTVDEAIRKRNADTPTPQTPFVHIFKAS